MINIILLLLSLLIIFFFIYNKQKENIFKKNIIEKQEVIPEKQEVIHEQNDHDDQNDQDDKDVLADINDEYILPTVHGNIITPDEAKYIINSSSDYFKDSITVGGLDTQIRKSKTAWHNKNNPIIKNIIMRVCKMTNVPYENAEHLQVVKYDTNGYYNEHYDTVTNNTELSKNFLQLGGHRIITMVIYLNDDFTEGATKFITLNQTIKPPKYSGILFYTLDKNFKKCHPKSLHAGLPIKSGNKYIANVWIRQNKFPDINNNGLVPF
jgi:prolyl 4-hydroxylase